MVKLEESKKICMIFVLKGEEFEGKRHEEIPRVKMFNPNLYYMPL